VKKAAASTAAAKTAAAKKAAEADAGRAAAVKKASTTAAAAKSTSRATAAQSAAEKAAAAKRSEAAKKAAATVRARKAAAAKAALAEATDAEAPATHVAGAEAAQRAAAKPTAAKKSTAAKSTAAKSTAAKSTAAKSTASKSKVAKSTAKSAPSQPAAAKTTATKPASAKRAPAKATAATSNRTAGAATDGVAPLMPAVSTDVVIALDSEPARRLVAASNSADLAEARPPRNSAAASATIVDDTAGEAPVVPAPDAPAPDDHGDPSATTAPGSEAAEHPSSGASETDAPLDAPQSAQTADGIAAAPAADLPALDAGAIAAESADADQPVAREAIRIRGLVKRFGDTNAVDHVDLTVPAGSFYGLVGPNGAGKTTTLSIIAGLLRPDAGTVHISGIDQREKPLEAKRVMGVLPDRLRTFDRLTGRQLLHYYGQLRGLDRAVIEKRTADLARAFDLSEALSRVVSDYSAGMTKKVMLAGALIHSPRVLVLDEPFEAVDPVSSGVILDILRSYVSHGGTVILSSHGMDLVERVCSRVAVIVGGEVLAEGTIDEVRAGQTLTERFIELSGTGGEVEGLEWLHTFSD